MGFLQHGVKVKKLSCWWVYCSFSYSSCCCENIIKTHTLELYLSDKPVIKDLPVRTTVAVGALAILPCQVNGDPEISVTWSKDGNTSIPRAQFENDGRILAIKDVLPRDSGVYECKASNKFGESRTATILIVAGNMKWLH